MAKVAGRSNAPKESLWKKLRTAAVKTCPLLTPELRLAAQHTALRECPRGLSQSGGHPVLAAAWLMAINEVPDSIHQKQALESMSMAADLSAAKQNERDHELRRLTEAAVKTILSWKKAGDSTGARDGLIHQCRQLSAALTGLLAGLDEHAANQTPRGAFADLSGRAGISWWSLSEEVRWLRILLASVRSVLTEAEFMDEDATTKLPGWRIRAIKVIEALEVSFGPSADPMRDPAQSRTTAAGLLYKPAVHVIPEVKKLQEQWEHLRIELQTKHEKKEVAAGLKQTGAWIQKVVEHYTGQKYPNLVRQLAKAARDGRFGPDDIERDGHMRYRLSAVWSLGEFQFLRPHLEKATKEGFTPPRMRAKKSPKPTSSTLVAPKRRAEFLRKPSRQR